MKCRDFWKEAERLLEQGGFEDGLSEELETHIALCDSCRSQWQILSAGFESLKDEVHSDEDSLFWIDMKTQVRSRLKGRKRWFQFLGQWQTWTFATATAAAAAVLFFGFIFTRTDTVTEQDIADMFGQPTYMALYEDGGPDSDIDVQIDQDEDEDEDPYILAGLTDPWSVALDQTLTSSGGKS